MTPDELRAFADRCQPWPSPLPIDLRDLAPVLARAHADLLDWAARAAEMLAVGLPPVEHQHIVSAFSGDMEGRCKTCDTHALLAEWDAMKERP